MEKKSYKDINLTDVIFEIKFPYILRLSNINLDDSYLALFQERVNNDFPFLSRKEMEEVTLKLPNNSYNDINANKQRVISWEFSNKPQHDNPTKIIRFKPNSIVLHYKREYTIFEDFLKNINLILEALSNYPVKKTEYIGIRYINQIPFEGNDLNNLIDPDLQCISSKFNDYNIIKSANSLEFKKGDYDVVFNFGQFTSNQPKSLSNKGFILDYTCRCYNFKNINEIPNISKEMNEIIYELFEKSISDDLRKKMGTNNE
jgi:uncharacterized protein (TIGR04255 family)